jgi:hypothetical protein
MIILDKFITGHITDVESSLKKSVSAYFRKGYKLKIGITNNPKLRANKHGQTGRWKVMILKYQTSSVRYINEIERIIIEHHWDYIENEVAGGGGSNGKEGPYYLYILLALIN